MRSKATHAEPHHDDPCECARTSSIIKQRVPIVPSFLQGDGWGEDRSQCELLLNPQDKFGDGTGLPIVVRIAPRITRIMACTFVLLASAPLAATDEQVRVNSGASIHADTPATEAGAASTPIIRRSRSSSADSESTAADANGVEGMIDFSSGSAASMAWPLLCVLGLIFGAALFVRRIMPRSMRASGSSAINIVARQYLSSKQSLCLVQVGQRVVLVGLSGDKMTALSEITDREEIGELTAKMARHTPSSFSATLENLSSATDEDESFATADLHGHRAERNSSAVRRAQKLGSVGASEAGVTDQRVRDLVSRIRALSVGASDT